MMKRVLESCLKRAQRKPVSITSRLQAIQIIGQRKAFCRQRIPESSCARKETVDIDIFITSKNDDRKIMQPVTITGGPATRMRKWNKFSNFRGTPTKGIPKEKTQADCISTMSQ